MSIYWGGLLEKKVEEKSNNQLPQEKSNFFSSIFIRFLGGKNLLFLLVVILLIGCTVFIYDKIAFVFEPLHVLFEVIILPGVLGVILFYLLRPPLKLLVRWKVPRGLAILIL